MVGTEKVEYLQRFSVCSRKVPIDLHILFAFQPVEQEIFAKWKVPLLKYWTYSRDVVKKKLSWLIKLNQLFWIVHFENYPKSLFCGEISAGSNLFFSWCN